MAVSYGTFPKTLAVISGIIAVPAAVIALFAHPAGFMMSFLFLFLWGAFLKAVTFVFEPQGIVIVIGEEPQRVETAEELVANILARQKAGDGGKPSGRILEAGRLEKVHEARIIGGTRRKEDPRSEEQKEDAEFADMMRSL
jgi:hypothetical protein